MTTNTEVAIVVAAFNFVQNTVLSFAQADAWVTAMINYGALGLWVVYLVWRDNVESKKRDVQHGENMKSQKDMAEALRSMAQSNLISMSVVKHLDASYADLVTRFKDANNANSNH